MGDAVQSVSEPLSIIERLESLCNEVDGITRSSIERQLWAPLTEIHELLKRLLKLETKIHGEKTISLSNNINH